MEYYKQIYAYHFDNIDKIDKFLERKKLQNTEELNIFE